MPHMAILMGLFEVQSPWMALDTAISRWDLISAGQTENRWRFPLTLPHSKLKFFGGTSSGVSSGPSVGWCNMLQRYMSSWEALCPSIEWMEHLLEPPFSVIRSWGFLEKTLNILKRTQRSCILRLFWVFHLAVFRSCCEHDGLKARGPWQERTVGDSIDKHADRRICLVVYHIPKGGHPLASVSYTFWWTTLSD